MKKIIILFLFSISINAQIKLYDNSEEIIPL